MSANRYSSVDWATNKYLTSKLTDTLLIELVEPITRLHCGLICVRRLETRTNSYFGILVGKTSFLVGVFYTAHENERFY